MEIDSEILERYLNGQSTEADLITINRWLAESEENRQELFTMEAIYKSSRLNDYSKSSFIDAEKEKFKSRIEEEIETRKLNVKYWLRYAAAAVVLIALSFGVFKYVSNTSMEVLVANQGKVENVTLSDGTKIWLNKSAKLKYPKKFKGKTRTVELYGEGYFEVAKNAKQPFVVETPDLEITVLGTTFNVSELSDVSSVTLIEGEVRVKGLAEEGLIVLSPGQKAELNKTKKSLYVKELSNASVDIVWHNGLIPFDKATIHEIGETLEHLYGVKVHIAPNMPNRTYSGVLKNQDNIATVLRLLKSSTQINYRIEGDNVYIEK